MLVKDLKFRDIDKHYFFIENLKTVKKIYKKLHIKDELHPILIYGYISHNEGILFRILGSVMIEDNVSKLEEPFIKNNYHLPYDVLEDAEIKAVPQEVAFKIIGVSSIEAELEPLYNNNELMKSRTNEKLDAYRDLRLIDDVQFLLLNREAQQENVWARIEAEEENGLLNCVLLDSPKKVFHLNKNDKIYLKYVDHPKYTGLMFVRKV